MNYHNITKEDMNNGDGLRTVLWVAGCKHHCPGCQNPITWDPDGGVPFDEAAEAELMESLKPGYISGITFSGGDPLATYNRGEVLRLIQRIRKEYPEKTIWAYTGYPYEFLACRWEDMPTPWPVMPPYEEIETSGIARAILSNIDVLVDGYYEEERRDVTLKWRGSSNQRVIDVPATLAAGKVILHCD